VVEAREEDLWCVKRSRQVDRIEADNLCSS